MYLMQFGYLPASDLETGALRTAAELRRAIRHFQRVADVRQTGRLDADTVAAMKRPRCGMADLLTAGHWTAPSSDHTRRHRHGHWTGHHGPAQEYAFGPSKWHKTTLTYRYRGKIIRSRTLQPVATCRHLPYVHKPAIVKLLLLIYGFTFRSAFLC